MKWRYRESFLLALVELVNPINTVLAKTVASVQNFKEELNP
jgi:hypothetical protein